MTAPPVEERLAKILAMTAEVIRPCRACGQTLFFVRHRESNNLAPYTADGLNHFIACPKAASFRKGAGRAATAQA